MSSLIFSLISILIISLISLAGLLIFFAKKKTSETINLFLVSFAIGALLGDAFIHLLPEAFESLNPTIVSLLIIGGMLLFFILEKVLRWHHCHEINCHNNEHKHLIILNTVGDMVHNSIDGMMIAASFMVDFKLGLVTSLAVLLHEIPQEVGDFAILIHAGLSPFKAFMYNLLSATSAFVGAILVFLLGSKISSLSLYLLPITAGSFIYLAASDLIPELHRHDPPISHSLIQLLFIVFGVALMSILLFIE